MHKPEEITHVLVVDDEEPVRQVLREYLETIGYRVTTAADAEIALGILSDQEVDLVISDFKMPGMNGLDFHQRIKEILPDIPFILCTAEPPPCDVPTITKPATMAMVASAVKTNLEGQHTLT